MAPKSCPRQQIEPAYSCARIINGCWQLSTGHGGNQLDPRALKQRFAQLVEAGFTTFDCADIYTGVERLMGDFFAGYAHSGLVQVHTKYVPDLHSLAQLNSRDTERIVHRSLRRLGRERLDLVQFHWWDFDIPGYIEAFGTLEGLREAGKIAHLGVTNFDVKHLSELVDAGMKIRTIQAQYSLLDRRVERAMQSYCRAQGILILAYGVLAGGLLARAATAGGLSEDNRSLAKYRLLAEEVGGVQAFESLNSVLTEVARKHQCTLSMAAAAWVLQRPAVGALILGVGNRLHIEENLSLTGLILDDSDLQKITQALERIGIPPGDVFELERQVNGPHANLMKMNLNDAENAPGSA